MKEPVCPICGSKRKPDEKVCARCASLLVAPEPAGHTEEERRRRLPAILIRLLDEFPGLADRKVVVTAASVLAAAFGVVILTWLCERSLGRWGLIMLPILWAALAAVWRADAAGLARLMYGSVCNPVVAVGDLPKGRLGAFVALAALPPFVALLFLIRCTP